MKKYSPLISLTFILLLFIINLFEGSVINQLQVLLGENIPSKIIKMKNLNYYKVDLTDGNALPDPDYINLQFYFKPTQDMNLDNIFQTSDVNSGIRVELLGDNAGLVVSDPNEQNLMKGFAFPPKSINLNSWHKFELQAVDGKFINARLDGRVVAESSQFYHPNFFLNNILIGRGFSDERTFNGEIKDIKVKIKKVLSNEKATYVFIFIRALILILFLYSIFTISWPSRLPVTFEKNSYNIYDPLLILRAIACFMVLVGHGLMINFAPINLSELIKRDHFIGLFTSSPWGGVWIFFTLSGYLMGKAFFSGRYTLNAGGIFNFYRNRILRIVPLYWVAVLIVCIFSYPQVFFGKDLLSIFRIISIDNHAMLDINPIGALWSISTEMQFYLIAPILYWVLSINIDKYYGVLIPTIIIIFGLLFRSLLLSFFGWELWPYEIYKTLIGNLDLFVIGFAVNIVIIKSPKFKLKNGFIFSYLIMLILYLISAWMGAQGMIIGLENWKSFLFKYFPTITALTTGLIIFIFEKSINTGNSKIGFIGKKLEIFGLLTYAVYIWHEPIFIGLSKVAPKSSNIFTSINYLLLACIPVLLISWIMWKYIEVPFEKKKKVNN